MARNARRATVSRGTTRRKLVWARQSNTGAAIAAGPREHFNADILAPFRTQVGASLPGLTVVRVRLSWIVVTATGQTRHVNAGLRVYTASPAPDTALLDVDGPNDDPHADWMMFDSILINAGSAEYEAQRDVDVKSMRRLEEVSDSLVLSFQAADELAAQLRYTVSTLVALP